MMSFVRFIFSMAIATMFLGISSSAEAALAIDASVAGTLRTGLYDGNTAASNSFSTTSTNELVLALIQINMNFTDVDASISGVTGAGLTWVRVAKWSAADGTNTAATEIWRAFAASTLTNQTATATISSSVASCDVLVTILSFSGVDTTGTNGSGAIGATIRKNGNNNGTPTHSLTTTRNGSWVVGSIVNWSNSTAPTVPAGQTAFGAATIPGGGYLWSQRQNAATPSSGTSMSINITAPTGIDWAIVAIEVLPSASATVPVRHRIIQDG